MVQRCWRKLKSFANSGKSLASQGCGSKENPHAAALLSSLGHLSPQLPEAGSHLRMSPDLPPPSLLTHVALQLPPRAGREG